MLKSLSGVYINVNDTKSGDFVERGKGLKIK
jgi:hypothetical protein